jgi:hypothetical protein
MSREICATVGRVTPRNYGQMAAGVNVSQGLYQYGPFLYPIERRSKGFSVKSTPSRPSTRATAPAGALQRVGVRGPGDGLVGGDAVPRLLGDLR